MIITTTTCKITRGDTLNEHYTLLNGPELAALINDMCNDTQKAVNTFV